MRADSHADAEPAPHRTSGDLQDRCVSAIVSGEHYGIPIADVQEIIGARPVTRVFHAPPALVGVTSLRGEILPVLDVGMLLGRTADARRSGALDPRIIVIREHAGARRRAGLRVDALGAVRELAGGVSALAPPPPTMTAIVRSFVRGYITQAPLCAVLDVSALLDAPVLSELAGREGS
jgi:purine-binding chemotaxis protein CheW